jgi:hypothetical protein
MIQQHKSEGRRGSRFTPEVETIIMDERGRQSASLSDAFALPKDAVPILEGVWKWMK